MQKEAQLGASLVQDSIPSSARIRGHLLPMGEGLTRTHKLRSYACATPLYIRNQAGSC